MDAWLLSGVIENLASRIMAAGSFQRHGTFNNEAGISRPSIWLGFVQR